MNEEPGGNMALEVLRLFSKTETEGWDLHAFFEIVAGNDPLQREALLDTVDRLVQDGYLESRGGDFYTLTQKGLDAARQGHVG
jgi:hypothetical protein